MMQAKYTKIEDLATVKFHVTMTALARIILRYRLSETVIRIIQMSDMVDGWTNATFYCL